MQSAVSLPQTRCEINVTCKQTSLVLPDASNKDLNSIYHLGFLIMERKGLIWSNFDTNNVKKKTNNWSYN